MKLEGLQSTLLAAAREIPEADVLRTIVDGLARQPGTALVRIWLLAPGDICESCHVADECLNRTRCLHLAASAGTPLVAGEDWSRTDGHFRRMVLGPRRKIGFAGSTGRPALLPDIQEDAKWIVRPDWARREKIRGFAA